jgi:hypothetical protein
VALSLVKWLRWGWRIFHKNDVENADDQTPQGRAGRRVRHRIGRLAFPVQGW